MKAPPRAGIAARRQPCPCTRPCSSPAPAAASATPRRSTSSIRAGARSPARATRCRRNARRDDRHPHITADLSAVEHLEIAIDQLPSSWATARCTRWSTMPASRRRARTASGSAAWTAISRSGRRSSRSTSSRRCSSRARSPGGCRSGEGAIVNITSIAGHRVHPFAGSAYSTSKAALWGLTRELAADLAPLGHPGQRGLPGRDQHRDPLARHRPAGLAHPDAPARLADRGRRGDLLSVRHRRRPT